MTIQWSTISFAVVVLIIITGLALWRFRRIRLNPRVLISATLAWGAFQGLFLTQGSIAIPGSDARLAAKTLSFLALFLTVNTVLQLLKWLIVEIVITRRNIKIPNFVLDIIIGTAVILLALILIREIYQVELTGFLVTSTVVSAIIGLSLQDVLSNLVSGVVLQVEGPFQINDWVEVAGEEGKVEQQSWRTLSIQTRENHHIILTNKDVSSTRIVNYSRPTTLQAQDVFIGVAYRHPPGLVKQVLVNCIAGTDGVMIHPQPTAYVTSYNDFAINYRVRYWIRDYAHKPDIEDRVKTRFWYALDRANMKIPFPIQDINMRVLPGDYEEEERIKEQQRTLDVLRPMDFLDQLSESQLASLVSVAQIQRFTAGEYLVHEGAEGDSLFVIQSGHVGVYFRGKENRQVHIQDRLPGEFFGEMSLLTGEPRSASVIAEAETEVIVIYKEGFVEVLSQDPSILELLLNALDRRRSDLNNQIAADDEQFRNRSTKARDALLTRITDFLGVTVKSSA